MSGFSNALNPGNADSPIGALAEPIQKYTDPLSWVTGGKWADLTSNTLPRLTNQALEPITQGLGSIDKSINPLRKIPIVNTIATEAEAKPADTIGLVVGSIFSGGALDGALAGAGSTGGAGAGATIGGLGASGTAGVAGAGIEGGAGLSGIGAGTGIAGSAGVGTGLGASGLGYAGALGSGIGYGTGGIGAASTIGGLGDAVGPGTAATSANDFGLAGTITSPESVSTGTFAPTSSFGFSGPVGSGGGASIGSQSGLTTAQQIQLAQKGLNAASKIQQQQQAAAPQMRGGASYRRPQQGSGTVIPAPVSLIQTPQQPLGAYSLANSGSANNSYNNLLQMMLKQEQMNPSQATIYNTIPNRDYF